MKKNNTITPQQEGRLFENRFKKTYSGQKQPGSGNGVFYKLDVKDSKFLWSLKWTSKKSFSIKSSDFKEVNDEVYGPGGLGIDYIPGLAIELEGEVYAVVKMNDLSRILEEEVKVYKPDKATEKRARAKIPSLLRQD